MSVAEPAISAPAWRKARRSVYNGDCVEVAAMRSKVLVRDSKNPGGAALGYSTGAWQSFLSSAKHGRFDALNLFIAR
jgi:hypothetical protein